MPATLHFSLREDWRDLKRGRPGHRFQDRYERAQREAPRCGAGKRVATFVLAGLALAIGLVLAVIPGPAIPFFLLAGALLATQSRVIARGMDWIEVRVRKVADWLKRRWRRLPLAGRIGVLVMMGAASVTVMFFTYRLFRG